MGEGNNEKETGGDALAPDVDESAKTRADEPSRGMPDWLRFPLVLGIVGAVSAAALAGVYALTKRRMKASESRKVIGAFRSIVGERYSEAQEMGDLKKGGYFALKDREKEMVAYAVQVECPGSYNTGEPIQLVVVLGPRLERILGARVVKSAETPGLGERIKEEPSSLSIVGWIARREGKKRVVLEDGGALLGQVVVKEDGSVEFTGADGKPTPFAKGTYREVTEAPFPPEFMDQFTNRILVEAKLRADGGQIDGITGATISSRAVAKGVEKAVRVFEAAGGLR